MRLTAPFRLCVLGVTLCVTMLIGSRVAGALGAPPFLIMMAAASICYLLAIRELAQTPSYSRRVITFCLLLATLWRVPFLLSTPGPQDDVLRYVWDGRLQRLGYNPYTSIPSDPALARLHTKETREINNPDVPSPYPAGAQLFFRAVTAVDESGFAFKVAFALCDLAIALLLLAEFRAVGKEHWVISYAWHPLLVTAVSYNGHIDILGVLLLLVSIAALRRKHSTVAAVSFGLAVAVKFLPVVLIPLYWRRVRLMDALLAVFVVALLYAPFLQRGALPTGSVQAVIQRFRFNDPIFAIIEKGLSPQFAAGFAVVAGLLTAAWMRAKYSATAPEAWAWPMAAALICAPIVYPWYLVWLVPFLRAASVFALMIWSLSVLSVFAVWYSRTQGHLWQVSGWLLLLEFGSVAAVALQYLIFIRRKTLAH